MDRRAMVGGMSASCGHSHPPPTQLGLRRVLWLALAGNASMFALELASGLQAQSLALWADAIDFFADAMAYAITLAVLGSSLRARLRAARFKALVMAALGLWVLGRALWQAGAGEALPHAPTMGVVGLLALVVNLGGRQAHAAHSPYLANRIPSSPRATLARLGRHCVRK